jgi:putative CocE/NonD family hydrolase
VRIPSLNVGGWYDCFLGGTLGNYRGMKERGGSEAGRRPRLIVGPWAHGATTGMFPEQSFGTMADMDAFSLVTQQIRFFDRHLRGSEDGLDGEPPVKLFVMGANVWRDEADWPLPDTRYARYYLHSNGRASVSEADGILSLAPPGDEACDVYDYDPRDPVPTVGGQTFLPGLRNGANSGPRDQRPVESRPDVLCFTTPALERDTEVTGPVTLTLYAASSARDTDFTGKLVDVHPSGRAVILTEGILRARHRTAPSAPELLEPGTVYELRIDLWATANVFKAGHRIRLEVASSNFPRFDRNTNTGGDFDGDEIVVAENRVYHDAGRPSHLTLPLIER